MALRSNYYNSAEVVLIQVSFLTVSSKQKNKNEHTEYHDIFISFKSHVYSKDGSLILVTEFSIISSCLGEGKVFLW